MFYILYKYHYCISCGDSSFSALASYGRYSGLAFWNIQCRTVSSYDRAPFTPPNMKKKVDVKMLPESSQLSLSELRLVWTPQEN